MMIAENAALYRRKSRAANRHQLLTVGAKLLGALLILTLAACTPEDRKEPAVSSGESAVPKSNIPLRVWFVADPSDKPVIERQWQATYDRPIDITIYSHAELLQQPKPQCDVLVYPAVALGDLASRKWIVELPSALQSRPGASSESESADSQPAGWLDQTRYDRKLWGISLSVITPVVIANFELPPSATVTQGAEATSQQSIAYWRSVIESLKSQTKPAANSDSTPGSVVVDPTATSDRFLTVFNSITSNENRISVLFDPETLAPRIGQASAIEAVKLLQEMRADGASLDSLVGSHEAAWNALAQSQPTVTICVPPPASSEADKISSYSIQPPPANPARAGMRIAAGTNVGLGLVVSMSKQCQQTGASIEFVKWLASDSTRQGFAKRIDGILAESAYAPGSSAWKAQRIVQRLGQQARLPSEPRLMGNARFREILGQQVAAAIQGQKSAEEAVAAVDAQWQEVINSGNKPELIESYVKSLGL